MKRNEILTYRNQVTVLATITALIVVSIAALSAASARIQSGSVPPAARTVAQVPFELNGNMTFLEVRVNGSRPLWFGLDTGAYLSVINTDVAQQLGLRTAGQSVGLGAGGRVASINLPDVDLDINGAILNDLNLSAMTLTSLENSLGRPMDGILGAEFFKRYVVEIDYEKKEISIYEPKGFVYSGKGEILPLTFSHNHPYVHAKISLPGVASIDGEFVIDSGSNYPLILLPSFIEQNKLRESLPTTLTTVGRGVGGEVPMPLGRVTTLEIGGLKLERPVTALPTRGWFGQEGKAGNIGSPVLRRFKVIFDYSRSRVILEPNKFFSEPFEHDMSGLSLVSDSPTFTTVRVDRVLAQSPAEEAGIKQNDEIVTVDGRPAAGYKLLALREMCRQPGRKISLQIKRGDQMIPIELKTRRLI